MFVKLTVFFFCLTEIRDTFVIRLKDKFTRGGAEIIGMQKAFI